MNFALLFAALIGYIVGSMPTAWIVMRRARGVDIRNEGSKSIGAHNTYDVSGSKALGLFVMLIDLAKGATTVAICALIFDQWFFAAGIGAAACIAGHNFNVWMGWKGGRGLAPAAGAWLCINPMVVVLWSLMYLTGYFAIRRNVHVGAMSGTLGLAALILGAPDRVLRATSFIELGDPFDAKIAVIAGCFFIFIRLLDPIRAIIAQEALEPDEDQE